MSEGSMTALAISRSRLSLSSRCSPSCFRLLPFAFFPAPLGPALLLLPREKDGARCELEAVFPSTAREMPLFCRARAIVSKFKPGARLSADDAGLSREAGRLMSRLPLTTRSRRRMMFSSSANVCHK
jgi:hypothetical protein